MASPEYRAVLRAGPKPKANLLTGLFRFETFFRSNVERNGGSSAFPAGWWQRLEPSLAADVTPKKPDKSLQAAVDSKEVLQEPSPESEVSDAGQEKENAKRCRISNTSRSVPPLEDEEDIQRQIQQLPAVTAEEEAVFPRLVGGLKLFLTKEENGPSNTEQTARSYVSAFQALFMRDRRSFQATASDEYVELIKRQFKGKQTHARACLFKFAEFYKSHASKNGGNFEVDPTWEEERRKGLVETGKPLPWHASLNRFFVANACDQDDGEEIKTDPPLNGPSSVCTESANGHSDDGQLETPEKAKRCRLTGPASEETQKIATLPQNECSSPDDDQDLLRKILELPEASDEERRAWPKLLSGLKAHMMTPGDDGVANTEATAMTYIAAIKSVFSRHGRSFETMASEDYRALVRGFKKSKTNHSNSCLAKFRAFHTAVCQKNKGQFEVDPDWIEMPVGTKEHLTDSHGELRDASKVQEGGSKYVGVFWHGATRKWIAVDKGRYIGLFATPELAAEARWRWKHAPKLSAGKNLGHFFRVGRARPIENTDAPMQQGPEKSATDELVEVSGVVPIIDPISLERIKMPVKGRNCQHIGAFDRTAYIEFNRMQEKNKCSRLGKQWLCPICGSVAAEAHLVVDTALAEVLEEANKCPGV